MSDTVFEKSLVEKDGAIPLINNVLFSPLLFDNLLVACLFNLCNLSSHSFCVHCSPNLMNLLSASLIIRELLPNAKLGFGLSEKLSTLKSSFVLLLTKGKSKSLIFFY